MSAALANAPVLAFPSPPPPGVGPRARVPKVIGQPVGPASDAVLAAGSQVHPEPVSSVLPVTTTTRPIPATTTICPHQCG